MRLDITALFTLIALQFFVTPAEARKGHDHNHDHDHDQVEVEPATNNSSGGGGSNNNNDDYIAGAAVAAAAGTCVRDWTKGMQYCASWAMVDGDYTDRAVHAFGGGVTTRVDQFAISFYGGIEDLDKSDKTYMLSGSINWR
jgi:hypothetical protein